MAYRLCRMAGAVLHSMNTRLDAASIAYQLDHAETKVLIVPLIQLIMFGMGMTLSAADFRQVFKQLALASALPTVIPTPDPRRHT